MKMTKYGEENMENEDKTRMLPHIPEEIIYNILIRIPLKSVLDWRRVSKAWFAQTISPTFCNDHAARSPKSLSFIVRKRTVSQPKHILFNVSSGTQTPINIGENFVVRSSCNGLVCLKKKEGSYCIYNPITLQFVNLPYPPPRIFEAIAIGFIPSTQVYKVIRVYIEHQCFVTEVCTLGTDTRWRRLDYFLPVRSLERWSIYSVNPSPVQINGALHWVRSLGHGLNELVSLDLETEQVITNVLKRQICYNWSGHFLKRSTSYLLDLSGQVAWLCFLPPKLKLFVLEEGGVWTQRDEISFEELEWKGYLKSRHILHPVVYRDGELFFSHFIETPNDRTLEALTIFNIQSRRARTLFEAKATHINPHTNTLASCPGMSWSDGVRG